MRSPHPALSPVLVLAVALMVVGCGGGGDAAAPQPDAFGGAAAVAAGPVAHDARAAGAPVQAGAATTQDAVDHALAESAVQRDATR